MSAPNHGFLWQIKCKVPFEAVDAIEEYLRLYCIGVSSSAGIHDDLWRVEGLTEAEPDKELVERRGCALAKDLGFDAPVFFYDLQPPVNWLSENMASFPPIRSGRYFIHGSHNQEKVPSGTIPLLLDAGTAFGSGEHPTTEGCLKALDTLAKAYRFKNMLDMGCGSGILSIAMAKTWHSSVLSTDIDPESVRVTKENAKCNQVSRYIHSAVSNGYQNSIIRKNGPYDLITANILARPLAKLSRELSCSLKRGGFAVLSGVLTRDAAWMHRVHKTVGLHLVEHIANKNWSVLIYRKK